MPTSVFEFDPNVLIESVEYILAKLPSDSVLGETIKQDIQTLIADISQALTELGAEDENSKQRLQQIEQIIRYHDSLQAHWPDKAIDPNLTLQQIKQLVMVTPALTSIPPVELLPAHATPLINPLTEPPSTIVTASMAPVSTKTEDDYRNYCWTLAAWSGGAAERKIRREIDHWGTAPYESPQPGDIILHGTAFTSMEQFPPVWIGEIATISVLKQWLTAGYLPQFKPEGQIWLSFADLSSDLANEPLPETPSWCVEHEGSLPFWHRWHDLLGWVALAPEMDVFIHNKHESLSVVREAIGNTLMEYHKGLVRLLTQQDEYHLSKSLHRVYSSFYQLLLPVDLDATQVPQHLFSRLREVAREQVMAWQKILRIEELHAAGALVKGEEYLGNVMTDTEKNTYLPRPHPFFQDYSQTLQIRESQVLYWLRPRWQLKNVAPTLNAELLGSVLYCFE